MSIGDLPILSIHPEPSPEELVAITAAVVAALSVNPDDRAPEPKPDRWSRAGRIDAMRGIDERS